MAVLAAEIKAYRATTNDDTSSNGGRINDALPVIDDVVNNLFPDLSSDDLADGKTEWRKLFFRVEDDEDGSLTGAGLYLFQPTTGATEGYLVLANNTDTQGAMASSAHFGVGKLDANVTAADATIDVLVKDGSQAQFRSGDTIRIADGTNAEYLTVNGAPSVAGDVVTLTLETGLPANSYNASNTFVSALLDYGTIETSVSNVVETTSSGTFDEGAVAVPNEGSIYQVWTLTFTSSSAFDAVGDTVGSVGSGNVSGTFAPNNPNTGTPYFSIGAAVWGGTWATAETVVFRTNPATLPVWVKRITPPGSSSTAGQKFDIRGRAQGSA